MYNNKLVFFSSKQNASKQNVIHVSNKKIKIKHNSSARQEFSKKKEQHQKIIALH